VNIFDMNFIFGLIAVILIGIVLIELWAGQIEYSLIWVLSFILFIGFCGAVNEEYAGNEETISVRITFQCEG